MSRARQKIQDTLEHLSGQLIRGWMFFLASKYIHQAYKANKITCAMHFFGTTYLSNSESAVLALSKLVIPHNDSVNIQYLLNCAENSPKVFNHANKTEILQAVTKHRQELHDIALFIENIKTHRDQTLTHLDRKYINAPETVLATPPVNMNEVERAFILVLEMVNAYKGYLDSSELYLAHLEREVIDDLEFLFGSIKEADKRG